MKKTGYILLLLLPPAAAGACPMCQGEIAERTISAYKIITVALTLLPFMLGGGIYWWIKQQYKRPGS
ncbi:MAG: hypothetical protein AB1458_02120 [Bacteroidota bacterium]